jgi:hypothetical protein
MKTTFKLLSLAVLSYSPVLAQAAPDVVGIGLGMTPNEASKEIQSYANEQKLRPLPRTINLSARNPATGRTEALPCMQPKRSLTRSARPMTSCKKAMNRQKAMRSKALRTSSHPDFDPLPT